LAERASVGILAKASQAGIDVRTPVPPPGG
jgi:hypothetical protein